MLEYPTNARPIPSLAKLWSIPTTYRRRCVHPPWQPMVHAPSSPSSLENKKDRYASTGRPIQSSTGQDTTVNTPRRHPKSYLSGCSRNALVTTGFPSNPRATHAGRPQTRPLDSQCSCIRQESDYKDSGSAAITPGRTKRTLPSSPSLPPGPGNRTERLCTQPSPRGHGDIRKPTSPAFEDASFRRLFQGSTMNGGTPRARRPTGWPKAFVPRFQSLEEPHPTHRGAYHPKPGRERGLSSIHCVCCCQLGSSTALKGSTSIGQLFPSAGCLETRQVFLKHRLMRCRATRASCQGLQIVISRLPRHRVAAEERHSPCDAPLTQSQAFFRARRSSPRSWTRMDREQWLHCQIPMVVVMGRASEFSAGQEQKPTAPGVVDTGRPARSGVRIVLLDGV